MNEHTPTPWKLGRTLGRQPCVVSIVTQTCARDENEPNARRKINCVNAFHDETRIIATEDINEGLFWRMYDLLKFLQACPPDYTIGKRVDALLQSLNIQEREG